MAGCGREWRSRGNACGGRGDGEWMRRRAARLAGKPRSRVTRLCSTGRSDAASPRSPAPAPVVPLYGPISSQTDARLTRRAPPIGSNDAAPPYRRPGSPAPVAPAGVRRRTRAGATLLRVPLRQDPGARRRPSEHEHLRAAPARANAADPAHPHARTASPATPRSATTTGSSPPTATSSSARTSADGSAARGSSCMNRPLHDPADPNGVDESTDTYDTVEWLLKNVPNNNGRVGRARRVVSRDSSRRWPASTRIRR